MFLNLFSPKVSNQDIYNKYIKVMSYISTSNSMLIVHLAAPRSTLGHREQCSLSYPMLKRSRDQCFEFNVKDFISTNLQKI